ncbi:hypothetical protein D3C76_1486880 [compost metagenome]
MALDHPLPSQAETRRVQPIDIHPELVDVVARTLLVQGMEQHALLHRCQWQDVLDVVGNHRQVVQLGLVHWRQREVGRGETQCPTGRAMSHQAG